MLSSKWHCATLALIINVFAAFSPADAVPSAPNDSYSGQTVAIELGNPDFEAPLDQKGRVPYWSEEQENSLLPGQRAGARTTDTEHHFEGNGSIAVTASGDWFAVSSTPYSVWPWWRRVSAEAMVQCTPGARARLLIMWSDAAQRVIGAQAGKAVEGDSWRRVTTGPLKPPKNTSVFRLVLAVEKKPGAADPASAWFDRANARVKQQRIARVVVNQVGYEARGPKTAIVLTNFLPKKKDSGNVEVIAADNGDRVFQSEITCAGRMCGQNDADWGWYFWRADFSALEQNGRFRIRAEVGSEQGVSCPFRIAPDVLMEETAAINVDFFFVQRCGCKVPGWHAPCHLDDARLKDGTHRDLVGGWHSAGDYNKLTWEYGDGGVVYALVRAAEAAPQYFRTRDRDADGPPDLLDEARWGAQYLAKLQDAAAGGLLNHIEQGPDRKTWMNWCPPERTTDNLVGTPDDPVVQEGEGHSPLAIGGWARLAKLLAAHKVQTDYVERAARLWEHTTAQAAASPDPLLLISSVDLYRVTGEERYLAYSRESASRLLASGNPEGQLPGGYGDSGDVPAAALAHFALSLPDEPLSRDVRARLEKHLPHFLAEADNPLGLMRQKRGPDGYFFEPTSALGCNYQICCRAWSALMAYRVLHDPRALRYAIDQLDFVLGRNPYNLCMMEGKGTVNLPRYHHRYITIPGHERGAVPGTVPNGFVRDILSRDRPGVDLSTGGRPYPSYRTNEPWLVHNVFYLLAVTALHEALK